MERRPLGRTGIDISVLGLGAHLFPAQAGSYYPGFYGRHFLESGAPAARRTVVERAVESGINLFASDFDFEAAALGRVVREMNIRERIVLTAVVDFRLRPDEPVDWPGLEKAIDRMLTRLGTDRLDLPQIRVSNWYLKEGVLGDLVEGLERLRAKGKITAPAFYSGDDEIEVLWAGLERGWFPVVMRAFGLLNPTPASRLLPSVVRARAGFIGFVPFQKGWLFDCGREAGLPGSDTAGAGLGWVLDQAGVTGVLFGASGPDEVTENVRAVSGRSAAEARSVLDRLTRTSAYDRFLSEVRRAAPDLAFDWRGGGA